VPLHVEGRAANAVSRLGERTGQDWLVYNPLQMHVFHRKAQTDAPKVVATFTELFPGVRRYYDIGSGSGAYVAEAAKQGLDAWGCEKSKPGLLISRAIGARCIPFDLGDPVPAHFSLGPADLVSCIEVAEHLPQHLGDRLVDFLSKLAPIVVFTAARPGQGGTGHINEQPPEYWEQRFAAKGLPLEEELTTRLRKAFVSRRVQASWLLKNACVYVAAG
jgi:SAM-dependent methyltransferase